MTRPPHTETTEQSSPLDQSLGFQEMLCELGAFEERLMLETLEALAGEGGSCSLGRQVARQRLTCCRISEHQARNAHAQVFG